MNQRIRILAEKSGFFPVPDETESDLEYRAENARYERFAKLIIEECIKLVGPTPDHRLESDYYLGGREGIELLDNVVESIKKHFGIKDD